MGDRRLIDRIREDYGPQKSFDAMIEESGGNRRRKVPSVELDAEWWRVRSLARRMEPSAEWVNQMSEALRYPGSKGELRPHQAAALRELHDVGLYASMRLGSGKTLVTFLAPTVLNAKNPWLLIPGGHKDKTETEYAAYARQGFRVRLPKIVSYESLSREARDGILEREQPDLILADEAMQGLKGAKESPGNVRDTGVVKRVRRYVESTPVKFVPLSATMFSHRLMEWHHLAKWALREHLPAPIDVEAAKIWHRATDPDCGLFRQARSGPLSDLPGGFFEWFRESRGVVVVPGSGCESAIEVSQWKYQLSPKLEAAIGFVEGTGCRPDGEQLTELERPSVLQQLGLGFFYVWDPPPPSWWMSPRRRWLEYARWVLEQELPSLDTEGQIASALLHYPNKPPYHEDGLARYKAWKAVEDRFEPNRVPVWLDYTPLQDVAAKAEKGLLIWNKFHAAGELLAKMGVPWYPGGTLPEKATPGTPLALSLSHRSGKNFQHGWNKNLVLHLMSDPDEVEQMVGRTHRPGQQEPVVKVELYQPTGYHEDLAEKVLLESKRISKAKDEEFKLVVATWV